MRERGSSPARWRSSSHALVLGRVDGVVFDVAVFLNLGRDHLDFHDDVEDYYLAKASLFTPERARRALINIDDEHGRRLAGETELPVERSRPRVATPTGRCPTCGSGRRARRSGCTGPAVDVRGRLPLPGEVNVANALAALAACADAGLDVEAVAAGIAASGGRARPVRADRGGPGLHRDRRLRPQAGRRRGRAREPAAADRRPADLVLGAGGDRDPGKRPIMGEIAAGLADVLIVTDDNPRSEDPAAIRPRCWSAPRRCAARWSWRSATGGEAIAMALAAGPARRHRAGRRQGPRDRPGGRRDRAPLRRPRRGARPAADRLTPGAGVGQPATAGRVGSGRRTESWPAVGVHREGDRDESHAAGRWVRAARLAPRHPGRDPPVHPPRLRPADPRRRPHQPPHQARHARPWVAG